MGMRNNNGYILQFYLADFFGIFLVCYAHSQFDQTPDSDKLYVAVPRIYNICGIFGNREKTTLTNDCMFKKFFIIAGIRAPYHKTNSQPIPLSEISFDGSAADPELYDNSAAN